MNPKSSLLDFNTFGIDVSCRSIIELTNLDVLEDYLANSPSRFLILGGGSNILFKSDYDGDILLNKTCGIEISNENEDSVEIKVASGENWHDFVKWTVDRDYAGIENLALIPGSVGAAPIQNIGAYGVEIKDVLQTVEYFDLNEKCLKILRNEDCGFGYRNSVFKNELKGQVFIVSISIKLSKNHSPKLEYWALKHFLEEHSISNPSIKDVFNAVVAIRQSKLPDPAKLGNSGSFFKNPLLTGEEFDVVQEKFPAIRFFETDDHQFKIAAGWLIEQCGWKGKVVGKTGSHKDQALVLVNYGGATGEEVWNLAQAIIASVQEQFGIRLEPEVNIL